MSSNNIRRNPNGSRRFLYGDQDEDSFSAHSSRSRNTQRSAGFSTRDYIVDQSVNLMDIGIGDSASSVSLPARSSSIAGMFRSSVETEILNRFDEYGDAAPMADAEEYIDNDKRRRGTAMWRKCRKALCSMYTLTLLVSLTGIFLVVYTLVLTVNTKGREKTDSVTKADNKSGSGSSNKDANHERYGMIRSRIVDAGVTSEGLFDGGSKSPQKLALDWLVLEDPANLKDDHPALLDRYGLAVFYYSSGNANKTTLVGGWKNSDNWMTGKGICSWHGVECGIREQEATAENKFTPFTKTYDADSQVKGIRLEDNNVEGTIPAELSGLMELEILNFDDNKLSHTLPSALGSLSKLKDLLIGGNALLGTLPAEYGELTEIHQLHLGKNHFEGPIPNSWLSKLTKLRYLSLERNKITGPFPDLSRMTRMKGLFLHDNNFEGTLPEWLGRLTGLLDLRIGKNKFEGNIGLLASLQNLETLHINKNSFTGSIPNMFDHLFRLHELVMNNNMFEGSIPLTLTHLQTLRTLNLGFNQLDGEIPAGLGLLTDIIIISLDHNRFEGTIPTLLGKLDDITDLTLSHNQFSGPIPSELGRCFRLERLHVQHNTLLGDIPPELGELIGLIDLRLESNQFGETTMPPQICALRESEELKVLSVDDNVSCECCTDIPDAF
ncbi:unnamed protein product [Pseudo-nitzschia multistriata]|uniref:Leucine-rich repeat-containing N-terminal plant-type domain-containing protein n=1 Tax=Pseudo-nitzschia multistriata TaxID=183589 RepID=A0A448Z252_9STRA|nr:unnamed protein product [Pseudo-nitzschia multistriata]